MSDLNQANYVLEEWAKWALSSRGFPSTSVVANVGAPKMERKKEALPYGIDHNSAVSDAIFVFHTMLKTKKGMKQVHILRTCLLERKGGESIKSFCNRIKEFNHNQYSAALNAFSNRLDMYYELYGSREKMR